MYKLRKYRSKEEYERGIFDETPCKDKGLGLSDAINAIQEGYEFSIVFNRNGEKRLEAYRNKKVIIYSVQDKADEASVFVKDLIQLYNIVYKNSIKIEMVDDVLCVIDSNSNIIELEDDGLKVMSEFMDLLTKEIKMPVEKIRVSRDVYDNKNELSYRLSKTEKGSVIVSMIVV